MFLPILAIWLCSVLIVVRNFFGFFEATSLLFEEEFCDMMALVDYFLNSEFVCFPLIWLRFKPVHLVIE